LPASNAPVSRALPLNPSLVGLLAMVVLLGMGERLAERFLPLYIIALGGGAVAIGALNGMDNLLSALYSFPGGYLSDRLGHKRALLVFNLIAIFGYLIVILFPVWQAVLVGSVFFISWTAISLPATMSVISTALPASRHTVGVSLHSLVRRFPMALGPLLGGLLIGRYGEVTGVRIAFLLAIGFGLLALVFQQRMLEEPPAGERRGQSDLRRVFAALPPALRRLLVSDILVRFCEQIPYAFVVVWAVNLNGISPAQFGVLTAIEMATAVLIYLPIAALADRTTKKPFVLITFGFFTAFPLLLLFSRSFGWLAAAFVVRGLKEFGEPARKALIMDLAPEGMKASGFGLYYLLRDAVVSLAAFGGAFLWLVSPQANFLAAFAFGVLGTLLFAVFARE
jgi:MFS family permease